MNNNFIPSPGVSIIIQDSKLAGHKLSQKFEKHGLSVFTLDKIQNIPFLLGSFTPYYVVCSHKNSTHAELTDIFGEFTFEKKYKNFDKIELGLERDDNKIKLVLIDTESSNTLLFSCNGLTLKRPELKLHTHSRSISYASTCISFTHAEFLIIRELINKQGSVVDKSFLSQLALRRNAHPEDRSIDVHICRIRKKLSPLLGKDAVKSVRGIGYSYSSKEKINID